ncbi:MAG: CopD family protein [Coxiellaceae bacterium]|nr:CopD family protein [Coxiellaceae bacterium]
MLWVEAFHIIFMVCWFAGLFYLPRLFVYHADAKDSISNQRFKVMERKLYYAITLPAAVLTSIFGLWLLIPKHAYYSHLMWMHAKLILVIVLWLYTLYCGRLVYIFKHDANKHSHKWFRWFNEVPSILLLVIVILVVVKP